MYDIRKEYRIDARLIDSIIYESIIKGRTTINDFVDFLLLAITFILYNLEISAIAQNDRRYRLSIKIIDEQISGHTFGQNIEFPISLKFLTFFEKTDI